MAAQSTEAPRAGVVTFPRRAQQDSREHLQRELEWARRRRVFHQQEAARFLEIESQLSRVLGFRR